MITPNRVTVVTLGVADLERSASFYESAFGIPADREHEGVRFFHLPGTWISLYPIEKLAEDISPEVPRTRTGFSGITLAHNARSRDDLMAIFEHLKSIGANIVKPPGETFWGGVSGYFEDPDGYHWEIVWGPMFDFAEDGALRFRE
jgi:catechol 2,3-dioxygenase-like lactoylglutathione lyase family enzyme